MLPNYRFVAIGMGALSSLLPLRSLRAQVALRVTSVSVQGRLDSVAQCPDQLFDPDPTVVSSSEMRSISATSEANASNSVCASRGTAQVSATFFQMTNGALQISGMASVNTLDTILPSGPPGGNPFAIGNANTDFALTMNIEVTRWCLLSFAGTMTIGTVTAVGSPELSSANLSESWELRCSQGRQIVGRAIQLGSEDDETTRQDTYYNTVIAGPGTYALNLLISGDAAGVLQQVGATGWTCTGTFGLALSTDSACVADWDHNGTLDSRDFFEFLNAFFLDAADFNEDSFVDSRDFFDFLAAYLQGCW